MTSRHAKVAITLTLTLMFMVAAAYLIGYAQAYYSYGCQNYASVDGTHTHYWVECDL